jgi:hypothetical protein
MSKITTKNRNHEKFIEALKIKANIFDELIELIEDRYFGYLMKLAEEEKNIPLRKAKKLFH